MSTLIELSHSSFRFKFGDYICKMDGITVFHVPVPNVGFLSFKANLVRAYILMPLFIDLLRKHELILDFSARQIRQGSKYLNLQINFKGGHVFIEWKPKEICLTKSELQRLQLNFPHGDRQTFLTD